MENIFRNHPMSFNCCLKWPLFAISTRAWQSVGQNRKNASRFMQEEYICPVVVSKQDICPAAHNASPQHGSANWVEMTWNQRTHRRLIHLLRDTRFARALRCAPLRSFVCSLARPFTHSRAHGKEVFVYEFNASISCSFNPLWVCMYECECVSLRVCMRVSPLHFVSIVPVGNKRFPEFEKKGYGRTHGWTNRQTDGRTDGRTDGLTDGQTLI